MLKNRYHLLDAFGIPVYVESSFILLLVFFILNGVSFSLGVAMAMVLAISVVMHELGHALTARAFGFKTNDITLSLLGGCASLIALPRKAWQEFLTALAGPLVSFLIAVVALFIPYDTRWSYNLVSYTYWLNIMLGAFNLLPGFPMDGGRIFRSVMRLFMNRTRATFIAMWVGRVFAVLLGLWGLFSIFSGGFGFIKILIAYMIWREGYREYLLARQEEDFRTWTQADFNARVSPPPYGE